MLCQMAALDADWRDRAELLVNVAEQVPMILVLDNFEDNLRDEVARPGSPRQVADDLLGQLLALLAEALPRSPSRLLITCRYPFAPPDQGERLLRFNPVGALTFAETMKLTWVLPGLDELDEGQLEQVWGRVGGHPRCLEYFDALLRGGKGIYPDVENRLTYQLTARLGDRFTGDQKDWFTRHQQWGASSG